MGTLMRVVRIMRGLKLVDMAWITGIDIAVLSRYERGLWEVPPRHEAAVRIGYGLSEDVSAAFRALESAVH